MAIPEASGFPEEGKRTNHSLLHRGGEEDEGGRTSEGRRAGNWSLMLVFGDQGGPPWVKGLRELRFDDSSQEFLPETLTDEDSSIHQTLIDDEDTCSTNTSPQPQIIPRGSSSQKITARSWG